MYKLALILIALALCFWVIIIGAEKEHQVWCDNHRYLTETTPQQWTPMLQDICGDF